MNTERITYEIQQMKGTAAARTRSVGSISPPSQSETNATDDDGRSIISVSAQSEAPPPLTSAGASNGAGEGPLDGPQAPQAPQKPRKSKRQLWDELTISCK
jgi:peroxin-3